jgi:DNA (cytosine-5)-methyltransferase 1
MRLSALDLFAGGGGLSYGLTAAGFDVLAACERDEWAADTLEANHQKTKIIRADMRDISDKYWRSNFKGLDLLMGGPPCQGFSISGKRQYGIFSEQNTMVEEFLRVALIVRPRAILIENVQGFRSALLKPGVKALSFVTSSLGELRSRVLGNDLRMEDQRAREVTATQK